MVRHKRNDEVMRKEMMIEPQSYALLIIFLHLGKTFYLEESATKVNLAMTTAQIYLPYS
jgi:hypothetical protein